MANKINQIKIDSTVYDVEVKGENVNGAVASAASLTETLPIDKGGTGATSAKVAEYNILGGMGETTAAITDDAQVVFKYVSPSTTNGVLLFKKASLIWNYIKSKADSVYAAITHKHAATDITSGTLSSDRLPTVPIAKGGTGATTVAGTTQNLFSPNVTSPAYVLTLPASGWSGGYSSMAQLKTALGLGTAAYTASTAYAAASHTHSNYLTGITKAMVTNALGYTPPTTNTTYGAATTSANGLMTAAMVTKLNGIATGATAFSCTYGGDSSNCYYKFSDGTLICSKRVTVDAAVSTAWGSLFESPSFSLGNWAYTFASNPHVSLTSYSLSSSADVNKNHSFVEGCKNVSTTSAGTTYLARAVSTTQRTYWVSVIGIGRWK